MKTVIPVVLALAARAHADDLEHLSVSADLGLVTGCDFGAGESNHLELGVRGEIGIDYAHVLGLFVAYRDMVDRVEGGLNEIDHDIAHYAVHGWAAGVRAYHPIPHGVAFAELYATHITQTIHGELGALNHDEQASWAGGLRIGAIASWHVANVFAVAVGGGVAFERMETHAEFDANRISASLLADAFVRIGVL